MIEEFFAIRDFRQVLKQEFEQIKTRRASYSMNAFARDIGLEPPRLNAILKGKYGISREAAEKIAERLNFSEDKKSFFLDLAASQHARTALERKQAASRIAKYAMSDVRILDDEELNVLAKWYYLAVLHLVKIQPTINTEEIAAALRISIGEAYEAIDVLIRAKEIAIEEGVFKTTPRVITASSPTPSKAIREFHFQFLDELKKAIAREPVLKRKNKSMYVAFDSSRIDEARVWLEKMSKQFMDEFCMSEHADSVYQLGVYLSRADQEKMQ